MEKQRVHVIVGNSEDYHAVAVQWALQTMGGECLLWDGIGSETSGRLNIMFKEGKHALSMQNLDFGDVGSIWFRRPVPYLPLTNVSEQSRKFMHNELNAAHFSAFTMLANASRFIVGSNEKTKSYAKAFQLQVARELGFKIPETLISNDPERVKSFIEHYAPVIVKHFTPHFWSNEQAKKVSQAGPVILDKAKQISDSSIAICPAIYQRLVEKCYEVRATVIGERLFSAKITSENNSAYLDWRNHCGHAGFVMSPMNMDQATVGKIRMMMARLGLKYGCIDMAIDTDNDVVFFEVNTGGQFLFVDDYIREFNLLGNFSSMLLSGSTEYPLAHQDHASLAEFEKRNSCSDFMRKQSNFRLNDSYITRVVG